MVIFSCLAGVDLTKYTTTRAIGVFWTTYIDIVLERGPTVTCSKLFALSRLACNLNIFWKTFSYEGLLNVMISLSSLGHFIKLNLRSSGTFLQRNVLSCT